MAVPVCRAAVSGRGRVFPVRGDLMDGPIRVLIVDDHPVIRRGLREIVTEDPDIVVGGEASSSGEAIRAVTGERYDVVLLDITMPGRNGLETLRDIKAVRPDLPVLMLSMHPEDQYALRALKSGAAGYLTKDSAPEELIGAIRKVTGGGRYITGSLAERLADEVGGGMDGKREPHELLSDREFLVLVEIARGKSISAIADDLSLSVKTISTYRTRILDKLGHSSTADLVRYALEHELIN